MRVHINLLSIYGWHRHGGKDASAFEALPFNPCCSINCVVIRNAHFFHFPFLFPGQLVGKTGRCRAWGTYHSRWRGKNIKTSWGGMGNSIIRPSKRNPWIITGFREHLGMLLVASMVTNTTNTTSMGNYLAFHNWPISSTVCFLDWLPGTKSSVFVLAVLKVQYQPWALVVGKVLLTAYK